MAKSLSEQLDELHAKSPSKKKCEHNIEEGRCVVCALIESKNRVRTNADFDREKREFHKMQEINNITMKGF